MKAKEIAMRLITGLVVFVLLLILVLVALPRGAARGAPADERAGAGGYSSGSVVKNSG